jgi:hypothetical protein
MSNKEIQDFAEKLNYGLALAERRMLEEKALHGEDIVVCTTEDKIQRIPASEALKKLPSIQ